MARPKSQPKQITCKNCNNIFDDLPSSKKLFCSKKCAQQYKGKDKSWLDKRKNTCLEKYGTEVAFQSDKVQQTYKENLIKKYGVDNPFLIKQVKDKTKQTNLERYGYEVASQNKDISNKISKKLKNRTIDRKTFIDTKWEKLVEYEKVSGMKPLFDKDYLESNKVNHVFGNKFAFQCNTCSSITEVYLSNGYLPSCNCSDYKGYSLIEDEIVILIKENNIDNIYLNKRDIIPNRLEIDIYLPDYSLAIEVNGVYWHSESMGKYKDYHLYKTEKCLEKGIELMHILDYEWIYKKPIISSIINNKLKITTHKIFARKCVIKPINDNKVLKQFLDDNHIQGYTYSSINIGLYNEDELVSVMTFSKNRFKKQSNEWEMVRFCNKINTNVVGGADKLFKYFVKNHNQENKPIVSFADRRFFNGGLYNKLGFDFEKNTSPSYIYWKDNKILNRMSCQKHKLHKLLDNFDPNKTEYENMKEHGWRRIWDCGNIKFVWNKKSPNN
jgi:hypothetical protein